jgi:hypothetical protein
MAQTTRPMEQSCWTQMPLLTTRGLVTRHGAPLTTFYNPSADCCLRTRDSDLYRLLPQWQERPFDARAVVPRRRP